ncbi:MAG: serine/threonine-protein kinase [Myxococcota bacterium]
MSEEGPNDVNIERERVRASARQSLLGTGRRFQVGRFELLGWLGAGAMGFVYEAHDPELHRRVALKILDQNLPPEYREERSARLLREAQALARVAHPNVVTVYDVGRDHGHVFVAMEKLEGESLRDWLASEHSPELVLEVMTGLGRGLAAVHAKGLAHRDFKPENALVTESRGVLVDFGLVRATGPMPEDSVLARTLTRTGVALGTPAYMSPEQLRGEPGDARSDQFAFCVALFEALVGRRPYDGINPADLAAVIADEKIDDEGKLPPAIRDALARGLSAEPSKRFESMEALLRALVGTPVVPGYRLEARIGGGGSGVVHRARHIESNQTVALKVLHSERDPTTLEALSHISHPSVISIRDFGIAEGTSFIVMDLGRGSPLRTRLGDLAVRDLLRIIDDVAAGLMALHAAGFVHRDVKPDNILVTASRATLVDLDIAVASHTVPDIAGTTPYLAPEQARGHEVSPATDQFALAVTAYEALLGTRPWTGTPTEVMAKLAVEEAPRPSTIARTVPARVDAVLLRALSKEPGDRYPDVQAFANALRHAFSPPLRKVGFALAALLAVAGASYALQPQPHPLERGVVACPIFEVEGVEEPNAWLGAAAGDLACHRIAWSLGGQPERTLVPAELLALDAVGGDSFPKMPFDTPGVRETSEQNAREHAAWLEGHVKLDEWEFQVTLRLQQDAETLGEASARSGLLASAISQAIDTLERDGALPQLPLDPDVDAWVFPNGDGSPQLGWLFDRIPHLKPAHPEMNAACTRLHEWKGISPRAIHAYSLCAHLGFEVPTVSTLATDSPAALAASTIAASPDSEFPSDLVDQLEAAQTGQRPLARSILSAAEAMVYRRQEDESAARTRWVAALRHQPRNHWMRGELVHQSIGNARLKGVVNTRLAWDPGRAFGYVQSAWWGDHPLEQSLALQRRAHTLARYDAPVTVHAIQAMLGADRIDDAQLLAAELASNPDASPAARAAGLSMTDSWRMRVGHATERLQRALERVETMRDGYTGDPLAILTLRKLAELMGRERELADWFVEIAVPDRLPETDGALTMPIAALCMYASSEAAARCFDALDALPPAPAHNHFDGIDDYLRGGRLYASGEITQAVDAWRGLPSAYYFAASLPSTAFEVAGEPELAARCDEVKMSHAPFAGLSRAQPSVARRHAARGEHERARELAEEVIRAWSQADVRIPGVEEMRELLNELMLQPRGE